MSSDKGEHATAGAVRVSEHCCWWRGRRLQRAPLRIDTQDFMRRYCGRYGELEHILRRSKDGKLVNCCHDLRGFFVLEVLVLKALSQAKSLLCCKVKVPWRRGG